MHPIDWAVLAFTLAAIIGYGIWVTVRRSSSEELLVGQKNVGMWTVGLGIMATQASAITFLSTPGQAYTSGMGFIQFYFGMPIAVVLVSAYFLPAYRARKAATAYEFLEHRFDRRVRLLTAALFLASRGLAAGITIYAPAIVLSAALNAPLQWTTLIIGAAVIVYTVSGGSAAVAVTQKLQMTIILVGMGVATYILIRELPVGVGEAFELAGHMGKLKIVDTSFDPSTRYTLWSGLAGGLFLSLSYFGTDQSQVQRYLGAGELKTSRMGLLFNGVFKVPMQFAILGIGVLLFVFYQFIQPPIFFNTAEEARASAEVKAELVQYKDQWTQLHAEKKAALVRGNLIAWRSVNDQMAEVRNNYLSVAEAGIPGFERKDADFVFLTFVLNYLPIGLVGLLLAVILSAAMSSTAGEVTALSTTTYVDYVRTLWSGAPSGPGFIRILTSFWGIAALIVALVAPLFDNLIQLVNVLGSIFYGTILGVFITALFFKKIGAKAVFLAALLAQGTIVLLHVLNSSGAISLGYLWYNVIGAILVIAISLLIQSWHRQKD
jgi:SSS family transporter